MAGKIIRPDDWDEGTLFHAPLHREPDRPTSVQGARDVKHRRTSQAMRLLAEYKKGDLTDEEAAVRSGIAALPKACYWKRCSDLRSAGYIVPTRNHEDRFCWIIHDGLCHHPRGPQGS
jgi:hypothetical protein